MRTEALVTMVVASALAALSSPGAGQAAPGMISDTALVRTMPGFKNGSADLGDVKLHYVAGGRGTPVVLLPGWPETWWEFHRIMPTLAKHHRVIAVDLRGMGGSSRPAGGYDKKTMASDIFRLLKALGQDRADIVGHDIGSQVAFAVAANHPEIVRKLVMLDVPHPDDELAKWLLLPAAGTFGDKVGDGSTAYPWWFAYHQVKGLPEALAADGRIAIEQAWFFHYLTQDERKISARDRAVYAQAYRSRDAIRAGDAWYQAFPQDIVDARAYAKLRMPVLGIAGPGYSWMSAALPRSAEQARIVRFPQSGHFIPEEAPEALLNELERFLDN